METQPETTTVSKSTFNRLLVVLVAALMMASFSGGYVLGTNTPTGQIVQDVPTPTGDDNVPQDQGNVPQEVAALSLEGEPFLGDENAPVVIVEFTDFQCPFCKRAHDANFDQIKENYIDTGKVLYIVKDFPLTFHPNADEAANVAACAGEEGKFWEMYDLMFANQDAWAGSSDANSVFKGYAEDLGITSQSFVDCVDSDKHASEIQSDYQEGITAGVDGTPTFFVNDIRLSGAYPYAEIAQIIDEELA